jgi:hypothetical protein
MGMVSRSIAEELMDSSIDDFTLKYTHEIQSPRRWSQPLRMGRIWTISVNDINQVRPKRRNRLCFGEVILQLFPSHLQASTAK